MKRIAALIVIFCGFDLLLNHSFSNAGGGGPSCANLKDLVFWGEERAENYIRPTQASDLLRFVLDSPRLMNRCTEFVRRVAVYKLDRNKELFEAALALETGSEFEPYIAKFVEKKGEPLLYDVRIAFSQRPMMGHYQPRRPLAACDIITRNIYIDRGYWESLQDNDKFKEALIIHELGHCDLNRGHVAYFSLMNDGVLTGMEYNTQFESQEFYDALYEELFSSHSHRKETHHHRHRTIPIDALIDLSIILNRVGLGIDEAALRR